MNEELPGVGRLPADLAARPCAGIVGARAATRAAVDAAFALARDLASDGLVVVSGGAVGVDAAAHEGALAGGGVTIAILGSGLDRPYPARNLGLLRRIAASPAGGAVVSPFALDAPPRRGHFPRRNALVASLADALVVIEAGGRSGALITAHIARRLGRPLLARPGSPGTERLLDEGAFPCESAADVRAALEGRASRRPRARQADLGDAERRLLSALLDLGTAPTLDELTRRAGLSAGDGAAALLRLELEGLVRRGGRGYVAVAAPATGATETPGT